MDYRLTVFKGDDIIFDKVIDADAVIELMRPTVALGGVRSEEELEVIEQPRATKGSRVEKVKNGKGCDECGSPSRHRSTCSKAKKK